MGCDVLQGYFIGRPARAHVVRELLLRRTGRPVVPAPRRAAEDASRPVLLLDSSGSA
jgi:hypothetical protein